MTAAPPSFFARLSLGLAVLRRVLSDPAFAAAVDRVRGGEPPPPLAPPAPALREAPPDAALQLLGLLQRDGRLIDFLQEEVGGFSDAQVGAAARVVHEGCRKTLREHVTIVPVRGEDEGTRVTLPPGFDAGAVRVVGNVAGEPPFSGTLTHRGWRAEAVRLPKVAAGHDVRVLAAAEVEL
jgi:hypothetical protein